jgi:hypothetical protein
MVTNPAWQGHRGNEEEAYKMNSPNNGLCKKVRYLTSTVNLLERPSCCRHRSRPWVAPQLHKVGRSRSHYACTVLPDANWYRVMPYPVQYYWVSLWRYGTDGISTHGLEPSNFRLHRWLVVQCMHSDRIASFGFAPGEFALEQE